ncbi:MAG TPA: ATP synthase subunit I [Syntrophales bacterium]|nr:ATP synthase subunit I [Syntrophales bacterium]HOL59383.1 ATP synthase subunit I [Syntrophales bacterium]HPO35540.1 ATP synthase subunit I [Syntrophales bacterium]
MIPDEVISGLAMGVMVGSGYFYLLWLTVRRMPGHQHPFRLMAMSFAARAGVAMVVFYLAVSGGHQMRLSFAVVGFLIAREFLKRQLGGVKTLKSCP